MVCIFRPQRVVPQSSLMAAGFGYALPLAKLSWVFGVCQNLNADLVRAQLARQARPEEQVVSLNSRVVGLV